MNAFAQSKTKALIYNRPLAFFASSFDIGIDKPITRNSHFGVLVGYGSSEDQFGEGEEMQEFKIEVNLKSFLKKQDADRTYYVQPFLMFKQKSVKETYVGFGNEPEDVEVSAINIGFLMAKRFNWDRIFMDLQVGGGIISPLSGEKEDRIHISNPATPYSKGVIPRFGINFGIKI